MTKQYAERDAFELDQSGGHYMRHVMAMSAEQLHSKSDIAAELAWRDSQIAELQQKLDAMLAENVALKERECRLIKNIHEDLGDADFHLATLQTPATDAALNAVRADMVESFTSDVVLKMRESGAGAYDYADIVEAQGQELVLSLRSGTHDTPDKAG